MLHGFLYNKLWETISIITTKELNYFMFSQTKFLAHELTLC